MCDTCGCGDNASVVIRKPGEEEHTHHHHHDHSSKKVMIETDILSANNLLAERNRAYFEARKILCINIMSSPGSGKTSLLERSIKDMKADTLFYVIEGDQQTCNDAARIEATGAEAIQINTGNGCHLDADMIYNATKRLDPLEGSVLIIENVGNLVCPSLFDLGESKRVVIISVTEGDDKPAKYPTMFQGADLCIINKTDLLPYVSFDLAKAKEYGLKANHNLEFIELSATRGDGMSEWYTWLKSQL